VGKDLGSMLERDFGVSDLVESKNSLVYFYCSKDKRKSKSLA
jgi:hypothetical protein